MRSGASTAAVLWLMILLVFLPIAAAHGLACLYEAPRADPVSDAGTPR